MFNRIQEKLKAHKNIALSAAALLGICLAAGIFILAGTLVPKTADGAYVIELRKDGFHPNNLTIKEGDTVVFTTKNEGPFWPASNVHPTHTVYPDFDPKKPIPAGESWSYTFKEAGSYKFHDHIVSTYEGEIIVEKKDGTKVTIDCTVQQNQQCWEQLILETLRSEGVKATFDMVVNLSETEPGFANDCHGLAHLIGEKAYAQYVAQENFDITPATSLCGYGFYHGFMETMLLTTGNIDEAREFCRYVDQKLAGQASAAGAACFHGTGHGTIDGSDPTAWGDIDAMMAPGFKLCALLATNELETYLCDTGVLNAIEILSADPKYGISEIQTDPFPMCNKQIVSRREGCYANMLPIVLKMTNNDFQKSMDYVNANMIDHDVIAIDGNTVNDLTTLGLMFEYIRLYGETEGYQEKGIAFCRAQEEDDRLPCIQGLSGGHIKYGEPGKEYVKNLEFCAHPLLTKEEEDSCYKYTLPRMSGRYNREDTKMICGLVPVEYKDKYCPAF
jgi:plastocyanin